MTPDFWIAAALLALFLLGNRRQSVMSKDKDFVKRAKEISKGRKLVAEGSEKVANAMERLHRIPANLREIPGKPHIGASQETQATWVDEIYLELSQGFAIMQNGINKIGGGGTGND